MGNYYTIPTDERCMGCKYYPMLFGGRLNSKYLLSDKFRGCEDKESCKSYVDHTKKIEARKKRRGRTGRE